MWVYTPPKESQKKPDNSFAGYRTAPAASSPAPLFSDDAFPPPRRLPDHALDSGKASAVAQGHVVLPAGKHAAPAAPLSRSMRLMLFFYAAGLFLSGVLLTLLPGKGTEFLRYYAENWTNLFCSLASPLHLFSTLFLSGVLSMTLLLVFGFCAFGVPLVYGLLLCKGAGSGLLALELFLLHGWKGTILYIVFPALTDIFLGWCLCSLGCLCVQNAASLWGGQAAGGTESEGRLTGKLLLNRYLFLCTLQILSCGLSAVLTQYAAKWLV